MAPTLIKPPPEDPDKAPIENVLDILELKVIGPNIFTNSRPLWHPPGARGIYGGAVIAMALAAGQRTVPDPAFTVHSCHCYFLLAGNGEQPVLFHVEDVRNGKSFATRTVQARQLGRCIFTVTMSFVRSGSGGRDDNMVRHAVPMPALTMPPPPPDDNTDRSDGGGPFQSHRIEVVHGQEGRPWEKRTRQWVRARGRISPAGGLQAHLNALAYMSDSYFIGTITRIHRLWRFPFGVDDVANMAPEVAEQVRRLNDFEGGGGTDLEQWRGRPRIGMMVSLDHTIYFHEPRRVRADEWMLAEMDSPWAGDGRGLVTQRIFAKDGTLLATCIQEGLVRLKDPEDDGGDASKPKL